MLTPAPRLHSTKRKEIGITTNWALPPVAADNETDNDVAGNKDGVAVNEDPGGPPDDDPDELYGVYD